MTKTQIYLPEEDLRQLHRTAKHTGKSVAALVREAIRARWTRPKTKGPVALWDGQVAHSALSHDAIYDEP